MKKLYTEENIQLIADAIREKNGETRKYKVSEMPAAILTLPTDGSEGAGGKNYVFITDSKETVISEFPHDISTVWLLSDTILSPDIELKDIDCSVVSAVSYLNRLMLKLTIDTSQVKKGEEFSIRINSDGYLNHNGNSIRRKLPIINTLELFDNTDLGRNTITDSYSDEGTCSITTSKFGIIQFPNLQVTLSKARSVYTSCSVTGNCLFNAGGCTLGINQRDNGYKTISLQEVPVDDAISSTRITWDGYMPYSQNESNRGMWDLYFLGNGDFYIRITSLGTNGSGSYQINGNSFTNPGAGGYVSFYRKDYYGTKFDIVTEKYDISKHHSGADEVLKSISLTDVLADVDGLSYILKSDVDDQTYTVGNENFSWPLAGKTYTTFYVSTNSWIGVTGSGSEEIKVNRKDAKAHLLSHGNYKLTDIGITCYKIRWEGYQYYSGSSSVNQIWELYLFENGDAMIRMEKKSTSDGTFSFFGTTFSINEGECVSFYRTGESTGKFTAATEVYDIAKHVS
jgi:hypothetical protein|nr:MAG TPA_asm: hypothetical protein [Caudoviricetes sp.]